MDEQRTIRCKRSTKHEKTNRNPIGSAECDRLDDSSRAGCKFDCGGWIASVAGDSDKATFAFHGTFDDDTGATQNAQLEFQDHGIGLKIHSEDIVVGAGASEAGAAFLFGTYVPQGQTNVDPGFVGILAIEGGSQAFPTITQDTVLMLLGADPNDVILGLQIAGTLLLQGQPIGDVVAFLQSVGLFTYVNGGELQGGNLQIQ